MTPVINPWVFYWMPICDILKIFGLFFSAVGLCTIIGAIIYIACESTSYRPDEEGIKFWKGFKKKLIPITIACFLIGVFVPKEETIAKMLVAQNVTYERVEVVGNTVEMVYNDILELFDKASDSDG